MCFKFLAQILLITIKALVAGLPGTLFFYYYLNLAGIASPDV